jgi:hypothetical protein
MNLDCPLCVLANKFHPDIRLGFLQSLRLDLGRCGAQRPKREKREELAAGYHLGRQLHPALFFIPLALLART